MSRRGENIYKRKDNRWEARIAIGYTDQGRKKYYSVYGESYTKVKEKKKLYEEKNLVLSNRSYFKGDIPFRIVAEQWLTQNASKLKQTTQSTYLRMLNSQLFPQLENKKLCSISEEFISSFLSDKLLNGRVNQNGGLSAKTVHDIQILLNAIFTFAEDTYGYSNPCARMKPVHVKNNSIQTLNICEQGILTDYILSSFDRKLSGILISLYMGIRLGEVCALQWSDIDFDHKILHIRKTVSRIIDTENTERKTKLICDIPKSMASIRDIPIPQFLFDLLLKIYHCEDLEVYILTGSMNKCMDPRTYQMLFKKILHICSIPAVNYHCLRHTFATTCISIGFDAKTLSEILGHASVNITLNRYVHSSMEAKQKQMDKLSVLLNQ